MRRSNTQKISSLIKEYIKESNIEDKLNAVEVKHLWEELLGTSVVRLTKRIYVKHDTLHATINSSVLKQELFMNRSNIIEKINKELGKDFIKKIVFH